MQRLTGNCLRNYYRQSKEIMQVVEDVNHWLHHTKASARNDYFVVNAPSSVILGVRCRTEDLSEWIQKIPIRKCLYRYSLVDYELVEVG